MMNERLRGTHDRRITASASVFAGYKRWASTKRKRKVSRKLTFDPIASNIDLSATHARYAAFLYCPLNTQTAQLRFLNTD